MDGIGVVVDALLCRAALSGLVQYNVVVVSASSQCPNNKSPLVFDRIEEQILYVHGTTMSLSFSVPGLFSALTRLLRRCCWVAVSVVVLVGFEVWI